MEEQPIYPRILAQLPLRGWIHTLRHSLLPQPVRGPGAERGGASTEPSLPGDLRKLTSFQQTVSSPVRKGPGVSSSQGGCGAYSM